MSCWTMMHISFKCVFVCVCMYHGRKGGEQGFENNTVKQILPLSLYL